MSVSRVCNSNGSGGDEINRGKRTREESRSVVVEKLLRKYKVDKLTVKFDPLTGKSVGTVGSAFNNMIAQLVRDTFSPRITRWKDVPKTDIEVIYAWLDLKFIYPHDDKIFMDEVERLLMKGLREWRHEMKKHWIKLGGREHNKEAPKRSPYKKIDPEDWKFLCDYFCSKEQEDVMTQMRDSQPTATNESVASAESGEDVAPKHLDIVTQVLGSRSRYRRRYDSMPRPKAVGGNRATSNKSASQSCEEDKAIAVLNEQVATQAAQLATQAEQLAQLYAQMQQLVPSFQYQQPTFPSSQTLGSSQDASTTT